MDRPLTFAEASAAIAEYGSQTKAAQALGMHRRSIQRALERAQAIAEPPRQQIGVPWDSITIPATGGPPMLDVPRLDGASAVVTCDFHCPYHNKLMLQRLIYIARNHFAHIDDLIIAGDTLDFAGISRHPKDEREASLDEELDITGNVLRTLCERFKRVWILRGNHDVRFGRLIGGQISLQRVIDMAFGSKRPLYEPMVASVDYMYLDHRDPYRQWIVGHPRNYSGQGGKTPSEIAELEHRNCATGHNHAIGMSQTKSGRYVGYDIGHMTIPEKHNYLRGGMTKFTRWESGFLILDNGYPYHFMDKHTDWARWGCR